MVLQPARDRVIHNPRVTMTGELVGVNAGESRGSDSDSYDSYFDSSSSDDNGEGSESILKGFTEVPPEATVGKLILKRQFLSATRRVRSNPGEAREWIDIPSRSTCSYCSGMNILRRNSFPVSLPRRRGVAHRRQQRVNDDNLNTRLQPLHLACQHLSLRKSRAHVEDLIQELIRVYPEACIEPDLNGRMPLHEVIAWEASTRTISSIMMAYPEALFCEDNLGLLPLERNSKSRRLDKEKVEKILLEGHQAWDQSRREALLRFRVRDCARTADGVHSQSVLSLAEALEAQPPFAPSSPRNVRIGQDALSDAHLALEGIYAGNRVLADAVTKLLDENNASRQLVDEYSYRKQQIRDLEDENVDLKRALLRRDLILHDHGSDSSGKPLSVDNSINSTMGPMTMDPEPQTVLTKYLQARVGDLLEDADDPATRNDDPLFEIAVLNENESKFESENEKASALRIAELEQALADAVVENNTLKQELSSSQGRLWSSPAKAVKPSPSNVSQNSPHRSEEQLKISDEGSPGSVVERAEGINITSSGKASGECSSNPAQSESGSSRGGGSYPGRSAVNDESVQTGKDEPDRTGRASQVPKKSTTSWGMLCLVQIPSWKSKKSNWSHATHLETAAMEITKSRLEEELLDTLIETSERTLHELLPIDVISALRHAAEPFDSLLQEDCDEQGNFISMNLNMQKLDDIFEKAQNGLGKPFSQDMIVAFRRATSVLQSRLEGTEFGIAMDARDRVEQIIAPGVKPLANNNRSESPLTNLTGTTTPNSPASESSRVVEIVPNMEIGSLDASNSAGDMVSQRRLFFMSTANGDNDEELEENELEDIDESSVDISVDISVSLHTETTRDDRKSQEFDRIIQSAKDVLGRDISPELLEALKLLSHVSLKSSEKQESNRPPPIRIPNRVGRGRFAISKNNDEDDEEVKSVTSRQSHSEVSLNLSAVFNPHTKGPSELERKLKNLENVNRFPATQSRDQTKTGASIEISHNPTGAKSGVTPRPTAMSRPTTQAGGSRGRSPKGGVEKAKSGDVDVVVSTRKIVVNNRRARSAERLNDIETRQLETENPHDVSLIQLAEKSGTDDLDQLFRRAAAEVEERASQHRSRQLMDGTTGVAAFEAILSDTEATYGIKVPLDISAALMAATLDTFHDPDRMPLIRVVQCLHDDDIIKDAGRRVGKEISTDLISAIRSASLPPGVSVETLRPPDTPSSVLPTKKYDASVGSMALSLALTDSSRHTISTRSPFPHSSLAPVTVEALRRFEGSATKKYDSSTESMTFSLAMTDSSRRSRSTNSTFLPGSQSNRGSTLGANITGIPERLTTNRLPPTISSRNDTSLDPTSCHSENSWGKLSVSKSPAITGKKRKVTKKYKKGTKEAMFERAQKRKEQVAAFMIRLADFGAPSDDLQPLFEQAQKLMEKQSLEFENGSKSAGTPHRAITDSRDFNEELRAIFESERSNNNNESITSAIPNPDGSQSCIATSPQESELDMLLARFSELADRPLPPDIDMALRKASRSMDSSLDMVSTFASLSDQRRFGTELSTEKLDFIYGEAEIFLGREIDSGILDMLMLAARDLLELEEELSASIQKFSASYASMISMEFSVVHETASEGTCMDSPPQIAIDSEEKPSALYEAAYQHAPQTRVAVPKVAVDGKSGDGLDVPKSAAYGREAGFKVESISPAGVITSGVDDLGAMYKAAHARTPWVESKPMSGLHNDIEEDDLQVIYKAAIDRSRIEPASPKKHTTGSINAGFQTPERKKTNSVFRGVARLTDNNHPGRTQMRSKAFLSPSKPGHGSEGARPLKFVGDNSGIEVPESEGFLSLISPMTEASGYNSFSSMPISGNHISSNETSLARKLRTIPYLSDSELDIDYEEDYLNPSKSSNDDSQYDDSQAEDSEFSGSPGGRSREEESETGGASASITSQELNAIISQARAEYGMELPPELVEALKTASTGSLIDGESVAASHVSSLLMHHTGTDNDDSPRALRELIHLMPKRPDENVIGPVVKHLEMAEYVDALLKGAIAIYGTLPENLHDELCQALTTTCGNKDNVVLTTDEVYESMAQFSKNTRRNLPLDLVRAFLKSARDLGQLPGQDSRDVNEAGMEVGSNAANGSPQAHTQKTLVPPNNFPTETTQMSPMEPSLQRRPSSSMHSSELIGVRLSGIYSSSDLEYSHSESTMNLASKSVLSFRQSQRSSLVTTTSEEFASPGRNSGNENNQHVEAFISKVGKEYHQPFRHHVHPVLKQASVPTSLSSSTESSELADTKPSELSSPSIDLPTDGAGLSQRVSKRKANTSSSDEETMPPLRSFSSISALTGFTGATGSQSNSSSEITTEHEPKENCDDADTIPSFASESRSSQLSPPLSPLLDGRESLTSGSTSGRKHFGRTLLKSVKEIYKLKIPTELSFVLTRSRTLPAAKNTDEEIQIILSECEDMSGQRLAADLVLALREAAVKAKGPPPTAKRSKLSNQVSGSTQSRSSGMPSIQEWEASTVTDIKVFEDYTSADVQVDRVPSSFGPLSIPNEIAAEVRSSMDVSALKDSQHTDGTSMKSRSAGTSIYSTRAGTDTTPEKASKDESDLRERSSNEKFTAPARLQIMQRHKTKDPDNPPFPHATRMDSISGSSLGVSAVFNVSNATGSSMGLSMSESSNAMKHQTSSGFNASTATMLMSNRNDVKATRKKGPMIEAIEDTEGEYIAPLRSTSFLSVQSTGSSTSTEVTGNNFSSVSTSVATHVSRASTLATSRLPIGVNTVPPLEGVETDDLSAIFKEAAKRFS